MGAKTETNQVIIPVNEVGKYGIISDVATTALPLNAWTSCQNVRFREGLAEKFLGHGSVLGTPSVVPYWLLPVPKSVNSTFWLLAGSTKVYCVEGTTHTNITRVSGGDYSSSGARHWTGGILGNVPIIHNAADVPQVWAPSDASTPLIALANWPSGMTARSLRVFKQFLVAMNVTKGGVNYPQMVKWSHPADPGAVPSSWDETDPTVDAGEYTLSEEGDPVLDSLPLRDVNVLYKNTCVYGMQYIGGVSIFRFVKLFASFGMISKRCVATFKDDSHLVFTGEDVVLHNGQTATSMLSDRLREFLRQHFGSTLFEQSFLVVNREYKEVWVCFPESGSSFCNLALIWNWQYNTWTVRDLPQISFAAEGVIVDSAPSADLWSNDSDTWASDTTFWSLLDAQPEKRRLLLASGGETKLYKADEGELAGSSTMTARLEKLSFGLPAKVDAPPDISSIKQINSVWPRITGTTGGTVLISLGSQVAPDAPIVWNPAQVFTIGTSKRIDGPCSGVLLSIKFESTTDIRWKLSGYDINYVFRGSSYG